MSEMDVIGEVGVRVRPIVDPNDFSNAVEQAARQASASRAGAAGARSAVLTAQAATLAAPPLSGARPGLPGGFGGLPGLPSPEMATQAPMMFGPMGVGERTWIGQRPAIEAPEPITRGSGSRRGRPQAFDPMSLVGTIRELEDARGGANREGKAIIDAAINGYKSRLESAGHDYERLTAPRAPIITPEARAGGAAGPAGPMMAFPVYGSPGGTGGRGGATGGGSGGGGTVPPSAGGMSDDGGGRGLARRPGIFVNGQRVYGQRRAPMAPDMFDGELIGPHVSRGRRAMRAGMRGLGSGMRGVGRGIRGLGRGIAATGRGARWLGNRNVMSTGQYMNVLFGGWELSKGMQSQGDAAATAAYFPSDFEKQTTANLAAADAIGAGILGSFAGMIADPFRTRRNAVGMVLGAGQSGNRLAAMQQGLLDNNRANALARQRSRTIGAGVQVLDAIGAAQGAMIGVRETQTQVSGENEEQAAGYRATLLQQRNLTFTDYLGGTNAMGLIKMIAPTSMVDAQAQKVFDVDKAVGEMRAQQRQKSGERFTKGLYAAHTDFRNSVLQTGKDLSDDADNRQYRFAHGDINADFREGMGLIQKERDAYNRAIGSAEDFAVNQLGMTVDDARGMGSTVRHAGNRYFKTRQREITRTRDNAQGVEDAGVAGMRADVNAQELSNQGRNFEAERAILRADFEMRHAEAKAANPTLYESTVKTILNAQEIGQKAASYRAQGFTNAGINIGLDTQANVLSATMAAGQGRGSRYAPRAESIIGGYRADDLSARASGWTPMQREKLGNVAQMTMEADKQTYLSQFRVSTAEHRDEIDNGGQFRTTMEGIDEGQKKLGATIARESKRGSGSVMGPSTDVMKTLVPEGGYLRTMLERLTRMQINAYEAAEQEGY